MTVNLSKEPLFEGQTGLTPKIRDGQKIKYAVPGTYVPGTYGAGLQATICRRWRLGRGAVIVAIAVTWGWRIQGEGKAVITE